MRTLDYRLAHAAYHLGFDFVRGSTNRGGVGAIRQLLRESEHKHLAITPDGPALKSFSVPLTRLCICLTSDSANATSATSNELTTPAMCGMR